MTIQEMEKALSEQTADNTSEVNISVLSMEEVLAKVPMPYQDLKDAFDPVKAKQLPPHQSYDHEIKIEGDQTKLPQSQEYLDENLKKGFISPSHAPYASPVLFAVKPNGSLRVCVDYRKLNAITKRNRYPIPLIEETLAKVTGCKYLTKLDVIAAFNKLRMHPNSEDYTTFITSIGAYKYHVLLFGLTNGPANYQHYMNNVLWDHLNNFCSAYLDDILIYSKTLKEHTQHVRAVLQKLIDAGLQVDIEKCEFHVQETSFLGVLLSIDGLRMDPKKAFIGFCNFYRRFIKGFSKIVGPMLKLTQKGVIFQWTDTYSSDHVNAGVLSQYDDDKVLHPVAFYSKNMVPAECNYEIYDKELLAIIRCLEHWRPELEATELPVEIFTDHKALEHFMTSKELTRRQVRWAEKLSEYNFKIMYQTGAKNIKADALTRKPGDKPINEEDDRLKYQHQTILTPDRLKISVLEPDPEAPIHDRILNANWDDEECSAFCKAIANKRKAFNRILMANCSVRDGILYHHNPLWVPGNIELMVELIREVHDLPSGGHPGIHRTMELIGRYYYWPNMRRTVEQYIRNCYHCHHSKALRDKYNGLLVPAEVPTQRWTDISLDFITGLPESEQMNAICTIIDKLSKERHYAPCHAADEGTSAEATAQILIQWVFRPHGLPTSITSDRGPQFVATVWRSFCKRLEIKCKLSTAFHPETDGQIERANQDIEKQLRIYCNYMQDDWVRLLPMAEFADNNAVSAGTSMTPFFANKGFHPRMTFGPDDTNYKTARE
ncbi:retrotransposon nucleocapsid protein [Lasallia pustulata]|uniref:Retrotransposon nucleocapsid protein n=1 Tax=Lasallia pustulata TaxID=136370 RepID=A0A1W5CWT8_9LECA|nr:retrotransposon nucleocapsid protein [Lasallia pustulata]